jgi:hypothetical protein
MAKHVELADLDKAIKLVEVAMKTETKKAKLREEQRKKAEDALEAFVDGFAARNKEVIATIKRLTSDLEKGVGVAQRELPKDHPLTKKLNDLIDLLKGINTTRRDDELNKAIRTIEDWDVALEKLDEPKKAISLIEKAKAVIEAAKTERAKIQAEYVKIAAAALKDLESVEDADVKKELAAILEGEL